MTASERVYFVEYLVNKKILTPEQAVGAIIQQVQTRPIMAEIALEQQFCTHEQMLQIFRIQDQKQTDFSSAARESGFLRDHHLDIINAELRERQPSLTGILTKSGVVATKELIRALDEFIMNRQTIEAKTPAPISPHLASPETKPKDTAATTSESSGPSHSSESSIKELCGRLTRNQVTEILNVLMLVQQNPINPDLIKEFLGDVEKTMTIIFNAAQKAEAKAIAELCSAMVKAINHCLSNDVSQADEIQKLVPAIEEGLGFCLLAAESISEHNNESVFWAKSENQAWHQRLMEGLQ